MGTGKTQSLAQELDRLIERTEWLEAQLKEVLAESDTGKEDAKNRE